MNDRITKIFCEKHEPKHPKGLEKEFVVEIWDGTKIYIVTGSFVRNNKSVEFIGGDNGHANGDQKNPRSTNAKTCPKNEIWVERMVDPTEQIFILIHELNEYQNMKYRHLNYEKAHDIANSVENAIRQMAKKSGVTK